MLSLVRRRQGGASTAGAVAAEPAEATHPRVGPYRLCLKIAAGGMATVYLARREIEHGPGRVVALKLIHPHLATDREFIEMFMDEAELAAMIRHPNVCGVLDYDLRHDEPYLVMEYLVGEPMMSVARALERSTDFDPIRLSACVARMLADACEGLHAAHELTDTSGKPLQVVHRDVSLENVFVTFDGVTKVMDFGVAAAAHKRHQTQTGVVKGKFASVAPECLKGDRPDRRADVWGIGVIAWELLTGQRLFRRESELDTLLAVREAPIRRPSECRPGLPAALDDIVMRALERDPDKRYPTARELGRDLARFSARGGEVLTSADVAEWLRELFPGGRERSLQSLELAERADANGERARVESAPALAGSQRDDSAGRKPGPSRRVSPPPVPPGLSRGRHVHAPAGGSRGHSLWLIALLAFLSATAGGLAVLGGQAHLQARGRPQVHSTAMPIRSRVALSGAEPAREIILRIRVDTSSANEPPTVIIDPGTTSTTVMEASAAAPAALDSLKHVVAIEPQ